MGKTLAALLVLLALTGCVQAAQPPEAGFTDAQSMARAVEFAQGVYPDGLPDDGIVTLVEPEDLGDAILGCLTEKGMQGFTAVGDGVLWQGDTMSDTEGQAWTLCSILWQSSPEANGALNADQLGYLYDYYRESVVPCLAMAGISLPDAPTRQQFIASNGEWQPVMPQSDTYVSGGFDIGQSPWVRSTPGGALEARCPTWPPEWTL